MKRKILPILSLMAAMTLVACGGNADKSGAAKKSTGAKSTAATSRHTHTYATEWSTDENQHWHAATCNDGESCATAKGSLGDHEFVDVAEDARNRAATCNEGGKQVKRCSVCSYEKVVDTPANYQLHNFGERAWTVTTVPSTLNTSTEMLVKKCSVCQEDDVILNALDYTAKGTTSSDPFGNKVSDGTRLKLNKNGNYVEYTFDLEGTFEGKMYIYGVIDFWKTSNNQNHLKGFYATNSGNTSETANLLLKMDTTEIEITNHNTYQEMLLPDTETPVADGYSGFGLAEIGAVSMTAGRHTLHYERTYSYNMDITEIHFIGTFTPHVHTEAEITKGTAVEKTATTVGYSPITLSCGKSGVALNVADDLNGKLTTRGAKLGAKNDTAKYVFPIEGAKKAKLYFKGTVDNAGNYGYSFYHGKNGGSSATVLPDNGTNTTVKMNGNVVTLPTAKYSELGMTKTDETGAGFFLVNEVDLIDGNNELTLTRNDSFGIQYYEMMLIY